MSADSELKVSFREVLIRFLPACSLSLEKIFAVSFVTPAGVPCYRRLSKAVRRISSARVASIAGGRIGFMPVVVWTTSQGSVSMFLT
jgi:hypothetical protein